MAVTTWRVRRRAPAVILWTDSIALPPPDVPGDPEDPPVTPEPEVWVRVPRFVAEWLRVPRQS